MNRTEIEEKIASYFAERGTVIDLSATFEELKIDSLDLVEFVMHLEQTFNVEINADDIDEAGTLGQFGPLIEKALSARQRN